MRASLQNVDDRFAIGFYSATSHETSAIMADHDKRSFILEAMWSDVREGDHETGSYMDRDT